MTQSDQKSRFQAKLLRPATPGSDAPHAFVVLPKDCSAQLPRRGRATAQITINDHTLQATLEPDGQLSHWLPIDQALLKAIGAKIGEMVTVTITPVQQEPEPEIPADLQTALAAAPAALAVWQDTTAMARLDWIHWVTSAKQAKTRAQRISNACEMLASGKRRVCCFDPSGYYSKAFSAPKAE